MGDTDARRRLLEQVSTAMSAEPCAPVVGDRVEITDRFSGVVEQVAPDGEVTLRLEGRAEQVLRALRP